MAKHIAIFELLHRMLLGLAILALASQAAMAQTTTLICDRNIAMDMGPTTIEMNAGQSTVTLHFPAMNGGEIPVRTAGPLPAKFSNDEIDFVWMEGSELRHTYVINRVTAVVQGTAVNLNGGPGFAESWTCRVGQKQF
jgi:hypothetical protein